MATRPKRAEAQAAPPAASLNTIEVKPEGTSDETVNQRRLREFYELQQQFYDVRDRYHAAYMRLQGLLISGASIQQGNYKLEYGKRFVRRPRYKEIVIQLKGEAYQKRILENTVPHEHLRVKVS